MFMLFFSDMNWCKILAATAVIVWSACSSWERVADDFPGKLSKGLNHERWTRAARIYGELETVALVSVTLLAPEMQDRLVNMVLAETPGRPAKDILGFAPQQTQATLVAIVSSNDPAWRRLAPPRSPWALNLEVNGQLFPATKVTKITPTAAFEWYFPAWNPWSNAWLVEFEAPVEALATNAVLHLSAGGVKKTIFAWP